MEQKEKSARGITRRDVAKAGTAAPLLMTLLSRPAWGGGVCSVSALASGNASGRDDKGCSGNGCAPSFWKDNLQAWQSTLYSPGKQVTDESGQPVDEWTTQGASTFSSVFGFQPSMGGGPISMLDVLLDAQLAGTLDTPDCHLVAAVLNASTAPYVFGATTTQIIELAYAVHTGAAYQGRMIERAELFELLTRMNEAGNCFLNSQGSCAPGFVEFEGKCIPSCKPGYRYDQNSSQCVLVEDLNDSSTGIDDQLP